MQTRKYYVLELWHDIEPILHGPFTEETERNECYNKLRETDPQCRNGLFCLVSAAPIELA